MTTTNAAKFKLAKYLDKTLYGPLRKLARRRGLNYDATVLAVLGGDPAATAYRRVLTRGEPLLFALLYFPHHLRSDATGGRVTFGDAHLAWSEAAKTLMEPLGDGEVDREASVAPREMGKSTWHFLLIPAWAAAHGHVKFIAAFADSGTQAETHLATFKHELETNEMLRTDYADLCTPLKRDRGIVAADRVSLYRAMSGFAFAARGIDARTLGLKIGAQRPDYILLDDIEPDESSYSVDSMKKRLRTLQDAILPLNDRARVRLVGTVTMPGSIVHQLVRAGRKDVDASMMWIAEDGWSVRHFLPIVNEDTPKARSIWPARWSLKHLLKIRRTRAYLKNFANDPRGADGDYWTVDDFTHGQVQGITRKLISLDPAVTTKASSDYTGLAIVGWRPPRRDADGRRHGRGLCQVERAEALKSSGADVRRKCLKLIEADPTIGLILVETNQGGDLWKEILWGMPVPVKTLHQSEKKEVRAADVLNQYQRKRVVHGPGLDAVEAQMTAFPGAPNDDLVDAVGSAVRYFLGVRRRVKVKAQTASMV